MMRRLLENRVVFAIIALTFLAAFAWNAFAGGSARVVLAPGVFVAMGPTLPPDPGEPGGNLLAMGPTLPPDPGEPGGNLLAMGPTLPPDPGEPGGNLVAMGPTLPPDPGEPGGNLRVIA